MYIGIDNISPGASTGLGTIGGMRAYLEDLLEFLPALRHEYTFKLFTPEREFSRHRPFADNVHVVSCNGVPSNQVGRVLYEQVMLPYLIKKEKVDVWLGICNILPLACPCPSVVIVQSLQYFTFPNAYTFLQGTYLRTFGPASAKRANRVIALSFAARDMILRRFGIPADRIVVAYNGLSQALARQLDSVEDNSAAACFYRLIDKQPYLLSVSSFYEYKNLPRLIQAFAQVSAEVTQRLMIVGAGTPRMSADSLRSLAHQLGIQDLVVFAGRVPHKQIATFYRHADALVMPSLEETFGLPILEAMALGCPVITSDTGSMAELAGDAAQLVDPWDVDNLAAGIKRVLNDAGYRDDLKRAGYQRVARFINNRSASIIADALEMVGNVHSHH